MEVAEKFISINGEGVKAGELSVFVRFRGCNLNCSWCDTKWASGPDCPFESLSPEQIAEYAGGTGVRNVTLTGGEPLLQPDFACLVRLLKERGHLVEAETNGSVSIGGFEEECRPCFTMDYKLPSSGCEDAMLSENMRFLRNEDTVKFVIADHADMERADYITGKYRLTEKCHVYLSPVFGKIESAEIAAYMADRRMNGVRLQLQLHKYIWDPDKRGV